MIINMGPASREVGDVCNLYFYFGIQNQLANIFWILQPMCDAGLQSVSWKIFSLALRCILVRYIPSQIALIPALLSGLIANFIFHYVLFLW